MFSKPGSFKYLSKNRFAIGILATLGIIDSLYLTWIKVAGTTASCAGIGDCQTVNISTYSEIAGIPVAALGLATYALIVILVYVETRRPQLIEWSQLTLFGLSLAGMIFSVWLNYVEIEILEAICPYCVISAILITCIFMLSLRRLLQEPTMRD